MNGENPGSEGGDDSGLIETELARDMSLFDITFIGVGAMIGAGVFALTGFAAGIAGPALTIAFILNGFVALFTAVSYAELGAAFPEAGGGYLWVKEALVDPNGFYAGWMSWFAHAVACSLYAITFGVFLTEFLVILTGVGHDFVFLGLLDRLMIEKILAVAMVSLFAYINYRGAEETGKAGIVVTAIKVVILGMFIVFGALATFKDPNWLDTFVGRPSFVPNGLFGIVGAMGLTYIAFEGYEIIVQSGEEVVEPGTNVPKAVFYSLAIVVPIYVLVAFAAIGGIDVTQEVAGLAGTQGGAAELATWEILGELGELGIIRAAGQFMPYGTPLLLIAGLSATMSALNATIYSSSRVSFAMGRDRALPRVFNAVHEERRTPHWAILLSAVLIAAMAVTLPIESVAASADIMFILLFVQVNWTVIKMRKTHPDLPRTYQIPWMPWPPLIGIGLQLLLTPFLIYELGLEAIGIGAGNEGLAALVATTVWMGIGLALYYGYSARKEEEKIERETPTLIAEREPADEGEYEILVPIADPEHVPQFMRTAIDLARDQDGAIHVMSVVELPQQTPLEEGREYADEQRAVLEEAMTYAEDADVPVHGTVKIGHSVSKAVLQTVNHRSSDTVLLGWRGRKSQRRDIVLGSNVDTIIARARCDVLVEKIGEASLDVDSILVPTAGGPHAVLAAEVAEAIAVANDADVHVVHVVDPDAGSEEREEGEAVLERAVATLDRVETSSAVLEGRDVADRIVEESRDHDLTVIGAPREGLVQQFILGAIPEEVGRRVETPAIMAKRNVGVASRLKRWFRMR